MFDKIIVITKKTPLQELIEKFNSRSQARFYIEHSGQDFGEYEAFDDVYRAALDSLRRAIPEGVRHQFVERSFLPNFLFGPKDLVVTLGPDGLVVNTAKYLDGQFIFAINPDRTRIDGVLLAFTIESFSYYFENVIAGKFPAKTVTMAQASLSDGQKLLGVNDIFIGPKSHVSLWYDITHEGMTEKQCSSGIIISTGAGSTGWFKSIIAGARAITKGYSRYFEGVECPAPDGIRKFEWDSGYLFFSVREPFESRTTKAGIVFGRITPGSPLVVSSLSPTGGVIFSDGIESDYLEFNSGKTATITVADKKVNLVACAGK